MNARQRAAERKAFEVRQKARKQSLVVPPMPTPRGGQASASLRGIGHRQDINTTWLNRFFAPRRP
ncbi:MAG: hypothetical protein FJ044_05030 [Candidatus Cloacimonetes bacterium]|nr:hypothetical protein [Candidatus Cloacimonadota bacterium]